MTPPETHPGILRSRREHEHAKVTFAELFFDLVFVFAVTQLSHSLLEDLTPLGALRTTLLFLAVWWVWVFTTWATNWLDPDRSSVRLLLFTLMLAGLLLSTSIPAAFADRAVTFAGAYVFMQAGRTAFVAWSLRNSHRSLVHTFRRMLVWFAFSGLLWIAGAVAGDGGSRLGLWAAALAIEYLSPSAAFWVPGFGRVETRDWDVEGGHMAERCGLFVIITLGESILMTGATFGTMPPTAPTVAAFFAAFIGSVAMWWIYFHTGAERGSRYLVASGDPGRMARLAYTYLHLLIVAGIIVAAAADELVLAHPLGHSDSETAAVALSGTALFLAGNLLFKRATADRFPLSHLIGLALLLLLVPATPLLSPLALGTLTTAVLVLVAAWETLSPMRSAEMEP